MHVVVFHGRGVPLGNARLISTERSESLGGARAPLNTEKCCLYSEHSPILFPRKSERDVTKSQGLLGINCDMDRSAYDSATSALTSVTPLGLFLAPPRRSPFSAS